MHMPCRSYSSLHKPIIIHIIPLWLGKYMSETLTWVNNRLPSRQTLVKFCVLICLLNIIFVSVLAGTGLLRTAERDDITYTKIEETPDGTFEIPADSPDQFAIERPTDADAYYNMVVRYRNGGPMFNPWGSASSIQRFHYFPLFYFVFLPLFFLGYVGFKFAWLALTIFATIGGTYLLLRTELQRYDSKPPIWQLVSISVLSAGFQPMITNFKVGQMTPVIYACLAVFWWAYRTDRISMAGAMLVIPTLIKPYFLAPFVLLWRRRHWRGVLGFVAAFVTANALVLLTLGPDLLSRYYELLVPFLTGGRRALTQFAEVSGFASWGATKFRVFYWFGDFAPLFNLLFAIALGWFSLVHIFNKESYGTELFAFSMVSLMFMIEGTISAADLAALLAVFIVFGVRFYHESHLAFGALSLSFALFQTHSYYIEATLGQGPKAGYIPLLAQHEQIVSTIAPIFQPGIYGIFILYGLCLYAFRCPTGKLPVPQIDRWREVFSRAEQ